jgi:hypothetical protein
MAAEAFGVGPPWHGMTQCLLLIQAASNKIMPMATAQLPGFFLHQSQPGAWSQVWQAARGCMNLA